MRKAAPEFDATGVPFKVVGVKDIQIRLIEFRDEFREEARTCLHENQ
jgi:hypothetical protein